MNGDLKLVDVVPSASARLEGADDEYSFEARMRCVARLLPQEERLRLEVVNEVAGKLIAINLRTGARRVRQ